MGLALLSLVGLFASQPAVPETDLDALRRIETEFFAARPACPDTDPSCEAPEPQRPPLGLRAPAALSTQGLSGPPPTAAPPAEPIAGFAVPVVLNGPVRAHLDLFRTRGKFLYAKWLARLGRYRDTMAPVLRAEGVPEELMYVALVESGLELEIASHAGAVGPWQMIAATAKSMGLRVDEWVDERRDPVKATRAAARYLSTLYAQFGSWPLALAGYNAGPATVLEAIRRLNTNDYWTLAAAGALPTETIRYVPRVYSAMIAGEAPEPNGFGDVMFEPPVSWREVLVPAGVDLRDLAKRTGVPLATLRALNPELKRGFTPPDGVEYPLRVPPERVARVAAVVDSRVSRLPQRFLAHRVRFGERLRDVAADYGASRAELRRLNELPEGEPAPGTPLLVPDRGYRPAHATNQLLVSVESGVRFDPADRDEVYFAVRYRMPLADVARFFGVTPADVGMWNGLDPEADLQRGMAVRLFVPRSFDTSTALIVRREAVKVLRPDTEGTERALSEAAGERAPTVTRVVYRVRRGDTLSRIAKRYNVTVAQLRAENGLSDGDALSPGDELHVPVRQKVRGRGGKTTSGGRGPRASLVVAGARAA